MLRIKYMAQKQQKTSIPNNGEQSNLFPKINKDNYKNTIKSYLRVQSPAMVGMAAAKSFQNLSQAKDLMDTKNEIGYDNYAHRLGMCKNGQGGIDTYLTGLGWGVAKEILDLGKKIPQNGFNASWNDSMKDMKNNFEGLNYGFNNPNASCEGWLENLDYKNNIWKK